MAQLIYYYQYPSTGVGTPSFNISFDGNPIRWPWPLRGGDGKGGPYDWADMPLDPINATPVQCAAIGALTYDAGVAVHMQYSDTVSGSTASLNDAQTALLTTFKYANAIITEASTINVGFDLQDMINPNLDAHRPVVFGIDNLIGGHCIVCDGYGYSTETLYHHLNMGWGGADNAWYHLPLIDLADEAPYYNFDTCLYNIFTNGSGEIISGRVLDTNGMPVPGASVTGYGSQGSIFTATTDNNGIYALTGVPSTSTCAVIVTNVGYYPVTTNIVTLLSDDNGTNCGNVWGVNFTLVPAQGPPAFDIQPKNQTVIIGSNAIFIANASGQLPLSYQWQYQPSGSLNWVNINDDDINSGAQTATLTITPKDTAINGEPLQCVAINPLGSTNSFQVILTVTPVPSQFIPIATLAGMAGTSGSVDGLSTNALFGNPHGIAIDNHTNIFIADRNNHVIRKMYSSGAAWSVTTIAGSAGNYGTNDGSGTNARFNGPYGVSVDNSGNVFVADTGNHAIRKLTPSGTNWMVSTIAGLAGSSGSANGSNAGFKFPMGISMDNSGNIYVADEGNHDIRKLTPIGTNWTVSTIAGSTNSGFNDGTNSSAQFGQPFGITVNNNGTVFVADQYYNTIRQLTPSGANWVVTTIAGLGGSSGSADGTGSGVRFYNPTGIAAGADGNLYVADYGNNTVRRMTLSGTNWIVATVAGLPGSSGSIDGVGSSVRFNGPFGIAVDNNTNVYVSDANNNTIRGAALTSTPNPVVIHLEKQSIDNSFEVTWNALVGKIYQVQFKTNLNQVDWINLTTTTATNWTGSALVPVGTDPQRFYRVVSQ
jgi:streptogramin lyase